MCSMKASNKTRRNRRTKIRTGRTARSYSSKVKLLRERSIINDFTVLDDTERENSLTGIVTEPRSPRK